MDTTSKRNRLSSLRMVVGFALVPVTAALIAVPLYAVMFGTGLFAPGAPINTGDAAIGLGSGVAFLAVLMTAFCAIPAVNWLSDRRLLSLPRVILLGAAIGNVPFAVIVTGVVAVHLARGTFSTDVGQLWYGTVGALARVAMGLIVGVSSAGVFWFVAIEGDESWGIDRR
jgi:hypothetical protein